MNHYIQFYDLKDSVWCDRMLAFKNVTSYYSEGIGDRAIIRVDARLTSDNMHEVGTAECRKRKYAAYRIMQGDNLLDLQPVSGIKSI